MTSFPAHPAPAAQETIMYDHIGLHVRDLGTSTRFYAAILGPLGHALGSQGEGYAGLGPRDNPALWLYQAEDQAPARTHVAFAAPSRQAVQAFHAAGLDAGGRDNGAPGPRPDYSASYYAAFLIDPDGNNVEAVCSV
jgi:catechol 2,3-dioxygenase-like lactoylglutathione lyase family enzyme